MTNIRASARQAVGEPAVGKAALSDRYILERELGTGGGRYLDNPGGLGRGATMCRETRRRFLMTRLPAERQRIAVVLNWFDELRAKSPR